MKVVFANVLQGFVYADVLHKPESMIFKRFSIEEYVEYFVSLDPDLLFISELLIENNNGNSEFADELVKKCNFRDYRVLVTEKSWLYVGRMYGMGIFSKYNLNNYEIFKLPNPKFEVDRPNGEHWILHDKYAQSAKVNVSGLDINIFHLHYFPLHHFNRKLSDPEMIESRNALIKYFKNKGKRYPTLVVGDFNNKDESLDVLFPELFENGWLAESIVTETTLVDGHEQLDHILYTPIYFDVQEAKAERYLSDHYSLYVDFNIVMR